jgi:hypothetical protein
MRGYIKHCISLKLIKVDPLAGIELVKMKTKGHHPWESNECAQYEEHYPFGTRTRLAYELLLQASQSRCDVVRMGRQHIRQGMMSMRRQKTDVPFNVKVMPRLQEAIGAMPASDHLTFLVTAQGKPFTAAGFRNWFRDVCRGPSYRNATRLTASARLPRRISQSRARPITSCWRGSVGRRSRRRRFTRKQRTVSAWDGAPASSFREQELAHLSIR